MKEIKVPEYKYHEMAKQLNGSIAESDKITNSVFFENKEYIICHGVGTGTGAGWELLGGYRIEPLSSYKGTLKPLERGQHWQEVELGRRDRSYEGRLISKSGVKYVICERYNFLQNTSDIQTKLF